MTSNFLKPFDLRNNGKDLTLGKIEILCGRNGNARTFDYKFLY